MPSNLPIHGYVLDRIVHGEKFWRIQVITQIGVQTCLVRISAGAKNKNICVPDLFDEVEIVLPSAPKAGLASDLQVAKEYRVISKCSGISRDYDVLIFASRWTFVLAKNHFSADAAGTIFALAQKVLKAFAEKPFPQATYLKALWSLAKVAGLPIREDWYESLVYDEREAANLILMTPLENLQIDPRMLDHMTSRIERWLAYSQQFRFNDADGR